MKKEICLSLSDTAFVCLQCDCFNVVGSSFYLKRFASVCCPFFDESFINGKICELWFYRGFMIFHDCDGWRSFVVPQLRVSRFFSLRDAKAAISRYLKEKKGGVK